MRLLPQCRLKGGYLWQRTTPATDVIEIRSEDELYAKLPLGAVSLEGELRASGRLAMQTTVTGQMRLSGLSPAEVPNGGACAEATHVVGGLSVGAFSLRSGGALDARAGARVPLGEAGVGTSSREALVREAGRVDACHESTDAAPHQDCRSPIQVFLLPVPWAQPEVGPAGMIKVNLLSAAGGTTWEVLADGRVMCQTPCSRWLPPSTALLMRETDSPFYRRTDSVDVPNLQPFAGQGPLEVRADTTSLPLFTTGLVFTTLSGSSALVGIVLTAVGFGTGRNDLGTGGLIALGVGAAVLVPSIVLMVKGGPSVEILPSAPASLGEARPATEISIGPGFVHGRF
jgi:hypothetical protein